MGVQFNRIGITFWCEVYLRHCLVHAPTLGQSTVLNPFAMGLVIAVCTFTALNILFMGDHLKPVADSSVT